MSDRIAAGFCKMGKRVFYSRLERQNGGCAVMIYEISKNILNRRYNGDTPEARKQAISEGFFVNWSKERIKNAFNNGNGTESDLKRYMNDNKQYCVFVRV